MDRRWQESVDRTVQCLTRLQGARIDKIREAWPGVLQFRLYYPRQGSFSLFLSALSVLTIAWIGRKELSFSGESGRRSQPSALVMGLRKILQNGRISAARREEQRGWLGIDIVRGDAAYSLIAGRDFILLEDEEGRRLQEQGPVPGDTERATWREAGETHSESCQDDPADFDSMLREALAGELHKRLRRQIQRLKKILGKVDADRKRFAGHEELQKQGELLKSQLYKVEAGSDSVLLDDYFAGEAGKTVKITLDPARTAVENMDDLFQRSSKYRRGLDKVKERRHQVEADLAAVQEDLQRLEELPDLGVLAQLEQKYPTPSSQQRKQKKEKQENPERRLYLRFEWENFHVYVGKNAKGNEYVTFRLANGRDIWFHTRNYPGSHLLLKKKERKYAVSREEIRDAAMLALYFSSVRDTGEEEVVWTEAKHVNSIPGASPGTVRYASVQVEQVRLDEARVKHLLQSRGI